jgi:hypothetical protein
MDDSKNVQKVDYAKQRELLLLQEDWNRRSASALIRVDKAINTNTLQVLHISHLIPVLMADNLSITDEVRLSVARELNRRRDEDRFIVKPGVELECINNKLQQLIPNEAATLAFPIVIDRSADCLKLFEGDEKALSLAKQLGLTNIDQSSFEKLSTLLDSCGEHTGLIRAYWPEQNELDNNGRNSLCNIFAVLAFYQIKNGLEHLLQAADKRMNEILANVLASTVIRFPAHSFQIENVVNTILGNNNLLPDKGLAITVSERTHNKNLPES